MTDAAKPKPTNQDQVFDIKRPGKSVPEPTTKAVIVGNGPILKDPMVVENEATPSDTADSGTSDQAPEAPDPKQAAMHSTSKLVIKPLDETLKAPPLDLGPAMRNSQAETPADPTSESAPEAAPAEAPTADLGVTPEAPTPAADEPKPDTASTDKPENNPAATPEAAASGAPSGDAKPPGTKDSPEAAEIEAHKAAEHDAEIQKLVDGKQYFLPINSIEKRRAKRFVVLGIIVAIILIAAWVDIALDAGLIHIHGVQPLTHFFSN